MKHMLDGTKIQTGLRFHACYYPKNVGLNKNHENMFSKFWKKKMQLRAVKRRFLYDRYFLRTKEHLRYQIEKIPPIRSAFASDLSVWIF